MRLRDYPAALTRGTVNLVRRAASALSGSVPVRPSLWGWVRESFAGAWQQGVQISPLASILGFSPVYACASRIAADIAKLGLQLMERTDQGVWQPATKLSPWWSTVRKPNGYQNRIQFVELWILSKLLYGNTYALKQRDERGVVRRLFLLDPRRVTPLVTPEGDVYYSLSQDHLARVGAGVTVPASEIIHDRGPCLWHPLVGISPLYACALAASQGMRIQEHGEIFFRNMSRPSGMLTAPGTIDETTAVRLKADFERNYSGGNIGRLFVAGDALKYEAMTVPAEAAQLIEQLKWTVEDVARAFAMPLYKIGAGPMPTANNVQALQQQYHSDCLQVHIEALEMCLDEGLDLPDGLRVECDLDGLLRMDSLTLVDVLTKAVGGALMSPDEARLKMNLPPTPGGRAVYLQQQNYSLAALAKRDARDDPFGSASPAPAPAAPQPAPPAPAPVAERAADAEHLKTMLDELATLIEAETA